MIRPGRTDSCWTRHRRTRTMEVWTALSHPCPAIQVDRQRTAFFSKIRTANSVPIQQFVDWIRSPKGDWSRENVPTDSDSPQNGTNSKSINQDWLNQIGKTCQLIKTFFFTQMQKIIPLGVLNLSTLIWNRDYLFLINSLLYQLQSRIVTHGRWWHWWSF